MRDVEKQDSLRERQLDTVGILVALWRRRRPILATGLVVFLVSVLMTLLLPRTYRSEGFFSLEMPITEYKRLVKRFAGVQDCLLEVLGKEYAAANPDLISSIKKSISNFSDSPEKILKPVYAYTREESRNLGLVPQDKKENSILGVALSAFASSPDKARDLVLGLGNIVRDQLMLNQMVLHINTMRSHYLTSMAETEAEMMDKEFMLEQLKQKLTVIRSLIGKYPKSDIPEGRQVISVQEVGYRYLPPSSQAVGIESEIADLEQAIRENKRKWGIDRFSLEVYRKLADGLLLEKSGRVVFDKFSAALDQFQANNNGNSELALAAANRLTIERQKLAAYFFEASRFLTEPDLPEKPVGVSRWILAFGLAVLSFLFVCMVILFYEWVKNILHADEGIART